MRPHAISSMGHVIAIRVEITENETDREVESEGKN
jgi:hypothetical protein